MDGVKLESLELGSETDPVVKGVFGATEEDTQESNSLTDPAEINESLAHSLGETVLSTSRRQEVRAQLKDVLKDAARELDIMKMTGQDRSRSQYLK